MLSSRIATSLALVVIVLLATAATAVAQQPSQPPSRSTLERLDRAIT